MEEKRQRMLLIVNPVSGKQLAAQYMLRMINCFDKGGYAVTACCTKKTENAYEIVKKRGAEFDLIVCCGGDGTLKETAGGVMELEKDIPIGYLPMGSTNDFAHSLGIPTDVMAAAELVVHGEPHPVDIGEFAGEHFIYIAGFGNFTALSYEVNQSVKNKIGRNAYYLRAAKDFFHMKTYHARVVADGETFEDDYFYGAVSSSYSIGGMPVMYNLGVEFDDGLHELVLVRMFHTVGEALGLVRDMLKKDVSQNPLLTIRHVKDVQMEFPEPTAFTLDGEFGGTHQQVHANVMRHAVRIITPKKENDEVD